MSADSGARPPYDVALAARRRAAAAWRLPALDGQRGRSALAGPGTYGLTVEELRGEARRLWAAGWGLGELAAVLALPELSVSA